MQSPPEHIPVIRILRKPLETGQFREVDFSQQNWETYVVGSAIIGSV